MPEKRPNILFLCTGNSCRSQMAEGWARFFWPDRFHAFSAGVEKHGLNPGAVQAMAERGVDISSHHSKLLTDLKNISFDLVITVCDDAAEACPLFPGTAKVIHHQFPDPPRLAQGKSEQESRVIYGRVCDEIKEFVHHLPEFLEACL
ncbi:MAG: arsenate reductase ArsC [Proteobacteria bacterium]|nr:arsenate reductase ArsC [Pseudomonadota bacterium]MBU1639708.1 arsenate reductase ArsC [Pseudomonadota bacterium]